jgi:hypothetical protein
MVLIINEISEFLTVTQPLRPEDNWPKVLNLFKTCAGRDIVPPEQFLSMIRTLRELHTSRIMELMVQYTLRNPVWMWKPKVYQGTIGQEWLEAKKNEVEKFTNKINNTQKAGQINALTKQIFESSDIVRLMSYTMQISDIYQSKNLDYFFYAEGLNYLHSFLEDYVDKEIKELCDILLIRGQWTNITMSREMSEALHDIMGTFESISKLDHLISEDGGDGSRLRAAFLRMDHDKTQIRYINSIIGKTNEEALDIINYAVKKLIILGKHIKSLIDDLARKHPELIINWRELNMASKEPINNRMVNNFKRINYFVQLMHLCAH